VVPSIGSTMNVGAGLRREDVGVGDDSSPRKLMYDRQDFLDLPRDQWSYSTYL